jgi:hypothetical protein
MVKADTLEKRAEIHFNGSRLAVRSADASVDEGRSVGKEDRERFNKWIRSYRHALKQRENQDELLHIGRDMYKWLDGSERWLERLIEASAGPPFFIEFTVPKRSGLDALSFLEVPWELLADEKGHLASDSCLIYCPVRRIGSQMPPHEPSPYRLSTVFMAAAPQGVAPHLIVVTMKISI